MVWVSDLDSSWEPLEAFRARPTCRRPQGRTRTCLRDYIAWCRPENAYGNPPGGAGICSWGEERLERPVTCAATTS